MFDKKHGKKSQQALKQANKIAKPKNVLLFLVVLNVFPSLLLSLLSDILLQGNLIITFINTLLPTFFIIYVHILLYQLYQEACRQNEIALKANSNQN